MAIVYPMSNEVAPQFQIVIYKVFPMFEVFICSCFAKKFFRIVTQDSWLIKPI